MKKCPMCAEEVQDEAKKCKHCGEMLESVPTVESAKSEPAKPSGLPVYKDEQTEVTAGAVIRNGMTYQINQLENIAVTELTIFGKIFLWLCAAFFGFFAFVMIGSISEYPLHFFFPALFASVFGYFAATKKTKWRIMAKQGMQEPTLYESYDKAKVEEVAAVIREQM